MKCERTNGVPPPPGYEKCKFAETKALRAMYAKTKELDGGPLLEVCKGCGMRELKGLLH